MVTTTITRIDDGLVSRYVGTKSELLRTGVVPPAAFNLGRTPSGPRQEAYDEFGTRYRIQKLSGGVYRVTKWHLNQYNPPHRGGPFGSPYDVDLQPIFDQFRRGSACTV